MTQRRGFILQSAAAASALAFPLVGGAQSRTVKVGILLPVTGALAFSGQQCREGALMAIDDVNRSGIKSLGGAKLEVMLGDAQSTPQAGAAEIEKMNEAGCAAVVGAYASAIGGAASSYKFLKEFPDAADGIIDCNHWFNPKDKRAAELRKRVEAKGLFFTYEVFNTYTAVRLLADAIEHAGRDGKGADRAAIVDALASSTFADHFMPYGATKFVNGQNMGAQPLMTQVVKGDIRVIVPREYREAEPVFPMRA